MYVTDTYALASYASNQTRKLSKRVLQIYRECEAGDAVIYAPAAALWELSILIKRGKINFKEQSFEAWCQKIFRKSTFVFLSLEIEHIIQAYNYNFHNDIFDLLIVATARSLDIPLITNDTVISDAKVVEIVW